MQERKKKVSKKFPFSKEAAEFYEPEELKEILGGKKHPERELSVGEVPEFLKEQEVSEHPERELAIGEVPEFLTKKHPERELSVGKVPEWFTKNFK